MASSDLVSFFSYTQAPLLGWLLVPVVISIFLNMISDTDAAEMMFAV